MPSLQNTFKHRPPRKIVDIDWDDELGRNAEENQAVFKENCTQCDGHISYVDPAFVCELDCTYCADCAPELHFVCRNCSGALRRRRPQTKPIKR